LIEKIDGVEAVDPSQLTWRIDDVRPVDPVPFT
jgi:hypothetical protein